VCKPPAALYPTRKGLAAIYVSLHEAPYPFTGASDHGVSEALYLDDPGGNGVELYWDRPRAQWLLNPDGSPDKYTRPLRLDNLMKEVESGHVRARQVTRLV
jgi:catechol 2,3-dioxygenase